MLLKTRFPVPRLKLKARSDPSSSTTPAMVRSTPPPFDMSMATSPPKVTPPVIASDASSVPLSEVVIFPFKVTPPDADKVMSLMPVPSPIAPTDIEPVPASIDTSSSEVPAIAEIDSEPLPELIVRSDPSASDTVPLERPRLLEAVIEVAEPLVKEKLFEDPPAS